MNTRKQCNIHDRKKYEKSSLNDLKDSSSRSGQFRRIFSSSLLSPIPAHIFSPLFQFNFVLPCSCSHFLSTISVFFCSPLFLLTFSLHDFSFLLFSPFLAHIFSPTISVFFCSLPYSLHTFSLHDFSFLLFSPISCSHFLSTISVFFCSPLFLLTFSLSTISVFFCSPLFLLTFSLQYLSLLLFSHITVHIFSPLFQFSFVLPYSCSHFHIQYLSLLLFSHITVHIFSPLFQLFFCCLPYSCSQFLSIISVYFRKPLFPRSHSTQMLFLCIFPLFLLTFPLHHSCLSFHFTIPPYSFINTSWPNILPFLSLLTSPLTIPPSTR